MNDRLIAAVTNAVSGNGVDLLELEWRVGRYAPQGFQPGVSKQQWELLRQKFDASTCWDSVLDQQLTEKVVGNGSKLVNGTLWNHKKRLFHIDFEPFVRVAGATEVLEPAAPDVEASLPPGVFTRFKERRSYQWGCWSFDLTKVVSTQDIDSDTCTYEVEIELIDRDMFFSRPISYLVDCGHALMIDAIKIMEV